MDKAAIRLDRISVMGIFSSAEQAAAAITGLRENGAYRVERVHGPIPSHAIMEALRAPASRVGWFTLVGGIIGFFTGFLLAMFTANRWEMIVGGKPIVALVPFFIVGFEFTILFSVIGNVLGLISQARLPRLDMPADYDPRFSGNRFGVLASCDQDRGPELMTFLKSSGAEIAS